MTIRNLEWQKNAPFCKCKSEEEPQRVLYICLQKDCHEPGSELYCTLCMENRVHKGPAVRIYTSVAQMLSKWNDVKQALDECYDRAH